MNATTRIRVLIHCRGAGADLFRTLVSLACQTVGPQRLNVILASTAPAEHTTEEARLLHSALGFGSLTVLDATGMHPAKALNVAALEGREEWLALAPEGTRLSPRFMASCLQAGLAPKTHAVYPAHTAGTPDNTPLTRMRPFNPEQLTRRNPVGPAVLVRRAAWETAGGLRPEVPLALWDLWLRLALAGGRITRVPELLAYCRPLHRLTNSQDGHAKALLVVSTPGAFEPDVCRWALALLRGEPWAKPFDAGIIPGPHEVRDLFAGFGAPAVPSRTPWGLHGFCTA
jgi:hypothetical protein